MVWADIDLNRRSMLEAQVSPTSYTDLGNRGTGRSMKRWIAFVAGVVCIAIPAGFFIWYLFWFVFWRFLHPEFYGQLGSESEPFGPVGTVVSFSAAVGSALLGGWLVRLSRGDDDRPRTLFSSGDTSPRD